MSNGTVSNRPQETTNDTHDGSSVHLLAHSDLHGCMKIQVMDCVFPNASLFKRVDGAIVGLHRRCAQELGVPGAVVYLGDVGQEGVGNGVFAGIL